MINGQNKQLKVAIIGLGNQTINDHIPSLLRRNDVVISVVCDIKKQALNLFSERYPELSGNVKKYTSFAKIPFSDIDFAILSVPHDKYFEIIRVLVTKKIPFIKEKPLARNINEMKKILSLPGIEKYCFVCSQRRYGSLYKKAFELIKQLGRPYLFNACYELKIQDPHKGWRGSILRAGGGCLIDMGYHIVDQLLWYFGEPERIFVSKSNLAVPRLKQYAEDTSLISFKYSNGLQGSITLSRSTAEKREEYKIVGSKAQINGSKRSLILQDKKGTILFNLSNNEDSEMIDNQLDFFIRRVREKKCFSDILSQHENNIKFIDRCYKAASK